jgi:deoxycytidine triphosphate deaminase
VADRLTVAVAAGPIGHPPASTSLRPVILSDRTIREQLKEGRIEIDPLDEDCIQPSSVDLHIDRYFRVFRNHTMGYIDVKQNLEDLTELIEVPEDEPFILHPGEFVLGSTHERVKLPDDLVARLEGKALGVDTPVPTPFGWTRMGDIVPGDVVFDEQGSPTMVVDATPELTDRPCREIVFSDGSSIVADASHRWVTCDKNGRRYGRRREAVRTTDEIERTLHVRGERNHQVRLAEPVQYPEKIQPVDPYVLGIWLGDGHSKSAVVTTADPEVLVEIRAAGYVVEKAAGPYAYRIGSDRGPEARRDPSTGRYGPDLSLQSTLADMDLLGNKHVPSEYRFGSVAQRQALLEGLMDSDGHVDRNGRCEYTSIDEGLADSVVELVASMGLRPVKDKKRAMLDGVDHGPKYVVKFTPHRPVFRLPRKLARQKDPGARFHLFRAISQVRTIPSVPVRCIEVANPSGLFLVGERFIPTHNSSLGRLGLLIHSTAGFVDAGWDGQLTLELSNVANLPITLYPNMKIGQISFIQMTTPADHPYGSKTVGSKYQGQRGPRPSRYWENFS